MLQLPHYLTTVPAYQFTFTTNTRITRNKETHIQEKNILIL